MAFGAQAGGNDPLGSYMQNYGDRLRSMLASDPSMGGGPAGAGSVPSSAFENAPGASMDTTPSVSQTPDLYQPPQRSALAPGQGPTGQGPGKGAGQGAGQGQPSGWSFRDMWQKQSKDQRDQYLDKLQAHLKQADQSIDTAYQQMMKQLGGRPDTSLSKDQKGMLLMEFGLRMMQNSSGRYGYGQDTGAAMGAAGAATMNSAFGLMNQNRQTQQRYDQMRTQMAIAQGREKAALASRSALETGRDIRSMLSSDTSLQRTAMQQEGAGQRSDARIQSQADRQKEREAAAAGQMTHFTTGEDGYVYGTNRAGKTVKLADNQGNPIKAPPGGLGGRGGRGTAAQANYNLYLQTYGVDNQGQPLQGDDMRKVEKDAILFASNPKAFTLTDPQMRQMAEKSADRYISANPLSWTGMTPDEVQQKHDEYAETEYQRFRRNGQAGPTAAAPGPRSAFEHPTAPGNAGSGPGRAAGTIPTQPQAGGKTPNAAQLKALQDDPRKIAPYFVKKFGYLPAEFAKYAQQSALQ